MPPASRASWACGAVLQALLAQLLQKGLLLEEMSPGRARPQDPGSATWLGLCKPAGSPHVRRIDFKVYPAKWALLPLVLTAMLGCAELQLGSSMQTAACC